MHKSYVWSSVGGLLLLLGTMMLVPAAAGRYYAETEYLAFLISAGVVLLIGLLLFCFFKPKDSKRRRLQMKDGYAVVTYRLAIASCCATKAHTVPEILPASISSHRSS